MLIQPKKDGRPRRVVDMSALTKVARRELHHTRSPFKVACSVPGGVLKTTLDCVDGYHGLEIAEEDRDKISFLTEWGPFGIGECHKVLVHLEIVIPGGQMISCQPRLTSLAWWIWRKSWMTFRFGRRIGRKHFLEYVMFSVMSQAWDGILSQEISFCHRGGGVRRASNCCGWYQAH